MINSPVRLRSLTALLALGLSSLVAPLQGATCAIDLSNVKSTVRAFGGSSVWLGALTDAEMDKLFTTNGGCIGLTIDRIRISPTGDYANELSNAQKAKTRGAIVMATPWTPPASMKSNSNTVSGSLNTAQYGAYATYLNDFVTYMANNGASLYAISVQNEPDIKVTYESCDWTPAQLLTFAKNNAGAISSSVKVMMSESFNYNKAYTDPILNDATARGNVDVVSGHIYGGGLADYPLARTYSKELWMTEHLNTDVTITGMMDTAKSMLDCVAVANFQTYQWWYLKRSYGPIDDAGARTKRGCVMAQFARWARPGYTRVATTYNPSTGVYATTFKSGANIAIVAVNTSTSTVSQPFSIIGGTAPTTLNVHRTSATEDLATLSVVAVSGGSFTSSLPGQSITTYHSL
jgi:glucuronoarabinoxylan endo-1,4-beta-xylanase